jgi:pSer/pThr/pTyr-binding forkhead associated (FHA) protein
MLVVQCPSCGRTDIDERAQICPYCGALLKKVKEFATTRNLDDTDYEDGIPRWGTARFVSRMNLVLKERDSGKKFSFDANGVTELTLGRSDPDTGAAPDVDLTECDAADKGVSRRHAVIIRKEEGALCILDKNAANGTYLNGQRLVANQARILRDGDEIRLGYLVLVVRFERTNANDSKPSAPR